MAGRQRLTVGGHSARSSTTNQHLGRWASTRVLEFVEEDYGKAQGWPSPREVVYRPQVLKYVEETYGKAQGSDRAAGLRLRELSIGTSIARRPSRTCPSVARTSGRSREPQEAHGTCQRKFSTA